MMKQNGENSDCICNVNADTGFIRAKSLFGSNGGEVVCKERQSGGRSEAGRADRAGNNAHSFLLPVDMKTTWRVA